MSLDYTHKLTLVKSTHDAVRTKETNGCLLQEQEPTIGRSFHFVAAPLEISAGFRMISTSLVVSVENTAPGQLTFKTENSTYILNRVLNT